MRDQLVVCENAQALALAARDWLLRLFAEHCNLSQKAFSIALSGGSTPKHLYQLLAELPPQSIQWERILLLWGDERNVPADHRESNFRMVKESLLNHIDIPADNIVSVPQPGNSAQDVADQYEHLLREKLHVESAVFPAIDCVLLGIGDDVHTASLFPDTAALQEQTRLVAANYVPKLDCWRITFTAPLINAARNVAFLLSGASKQRALQKLWHAAYDPVRFPAQLIRPKHGRLWYFLDHAALGSVEPPASARE